VASGARRRRPRKPRPAARTSGGRSEPYAQPKGELGLGFTFGAHTYLAGDHIGLAFDQIAEALANPVTGKLGDLLERVRRLAHCYRGHVAPAAIDDIAQCIEREIDRKRANQPHYFNGWDPSKHDRRHQAEARPAARPCPRHATARAKLDEPPRRDRRRPDA